LPPLAFLAFSYRSLQTFFAYIFILVTSWKIP
jgi:hypothetical protein